MSRPRRWARCRARRAWGLIWLAGSLTGIRLRATVSSLIFVWVSVMACWAAGVAVFFVSADVPPVSRAPRARSASAWAVLAARIAALASLRAGLSMSLVLTAMSAW